MNYDDELERSRAKRSRKRGAAAGANASSHKSNTTDGAWDSLAEPGSRLEKKRSKTSGGNKKGGGKWKKIVLGVLLALIALTAIALIAVYAYIKPKMDMVRPDNFDVKEVENVQLSQETKAKMEEGYWTIAVFGLDSRDSSLSGYQSDVIMIVNVDRKTGEIKLASVFRDTYLNVSDRNTYNKINAAYAQGGATAALKALNKNLDLNITDYATFNWKAVATAINILGGVDIEISKSEFYYINAFITETVKGTGIGSVQLKSAGMNHLDGVQAVAYGRLRLMDTDYARTERQRLVIQKAFEKAKTADLSQLHSIVAHMAEMCETNIAINDIAALVPNVAKYHLGETVGFPMARGESRIQIGSSSQSCVIPQTLVSNVSSLHAFLFGEENYEPTSQVQTISAKIAEISGLSKEGKEVGHVRTDQGYVPKSTTAAATTASSETKTTEREQSSEGSSSSDGSVRETVPGESGLHSGPAAETSGSGMSAGNQGELMTDPTSPTAPTVPTAPTNSVRETNEDGRPRSPADVIGETAETYGPGFEAAPTDSPMYPGQRPTAAEPTTGASSVVIEPATAASAPGPAPTASSTPAPGNSPASGSAPTAPSNNTIPSSPADVLSPGNGSGPAGPGGV